MVVMAIFAKFAVVVKGIVHTAPLVSIVREPPKVESLAFHLTVIKVVEVFFRNWLRCFEHHLIPVFASAIDMFVANCSSLFL